MQRIEADDSLPNQGDVKSKSSTTKIEPERTTISSVDPSPADSPGSDADTEHLPTANGSARVEEESENTSEKEFKESEPSCEDESGEAGEWNCTIQ